MRTRADILADNEDIMKKPTTTGIRNSDDLRRLAANNVELMAVLHQEIGEFKEYVEQYAKKADQISTSNRRIAIVAVIIAALSFIAQLFK